MSQLNRRSISKRDKELGQVSRRGKRQASTVNQQIITSKHDFLRAEERLFYLEDVQERSIYELRERQEEEMSQQEVALFYSFLNQVEEEIQKQQTLVKEVHQALNLKENPPLHLPRKVSLLG